MANLKLAKPEQPKDLIAFRDVEYGEVFRYGGLVYVKLDSYEREMAGTANGITNCIQIYSYGAFRGFIEPYSMVRLAKSAELKAVFSEE